MVKYARIAQGVLCEDPVSIERPFSNYQFVESRFGGRFTLRRIMSQVRQLHGRTLIIEELEEADEIAEENEDLRKVVPGYCPGPTYRLTFFSEEFRSTQDLREIAPEAFLGYAILKHDAATPSGRTRVFESVIAGPADKRRYVHGQQDWDCQVADTRFQVAGYLYAQQNALTVACAHVALKAILPRFGHCPTYRHINQRVGIDFEERRDVGLKAGEIVDLLDSFGIQCNVIDYTDAPSATDGSEDSETNVGSKANHHGVTYQHLLYGSVESGFPGLLGFGTREEDQDHIIPVFGHTFNEDAWAGPAGYMYFTVEDRLKHIPSERWFNGFVAHDDNWGSNLLVPRGFLPPMRYCEQMRDESGELVRMEDGILPQCPVGGESVHVAIGTLPTEVAVTPDAAEIMASDFLTHIVENLPAGSGSWAQRVKSYHRQGMLVLRPVLITWGDYGKHLAELKNWKRQGAIDPLLVVHNT